MTTLQTVWFFIIGILFIGYAVLDGFDLGVGFWHLFTRKNEYRSVNIKAIGPVWDGNEVWLLTAGGALFAAFPPVYAVTFSGFYLAIMLVIFALIFRAISIELRNIENGKTWKSFWDFMFFTGSIIPTLIFGVAVGNIIRGIPLDMNANYVGGFFALLNPFSILIGITAILMFATHGALYISLKCSGNYKKIMIDRANKTSFIYLTLVIVAAVWSALSFSEPVKNYMEHKILWVLPVLGAFSIVLINLFIKQKKELKAFLASSASIILLITTVGFSIFPVWVRSTSPYGASLTIYNSSSSENTLSVMLILALIGMPIVIFYTYFVYKLFKGNVKVDDVGY